MNHAITRRKFISHSLSGGALLIAAPVFNSAQAEMVSDKPTSSAITPLIKIH